VANEIASNPLRVERGHIRLPTGPGIGLELDEQALARYPYRGARWRALPRYEVEGR
jgi:L-alanine-DL-glutamate epimerase-like enolase superfamily enzyme